jgi:diguanylate cyclase (GGDEF)-like protein
MSFRTRLTSFFVLIVVVPLLAVGFMVFRLIGDSENGKADARASGLASAAASLYTSLSAGARADAATLARNGALLTGPSLKARLTAFATQAGLTRVMLSSGSRVIVDVGDHNAIAPGVATVRIPGRSTTLTVRVATLTAAEYTRDLANARGVEVVVREAGRILHSTLRHVPDHALPRRGSITISSVEYRVLTQSFQAFGKAPIEVTVLSDRSATSSSLGTSRVVAAVFIVCFLLLAFSFSVLASRALQGQVSRFLEAAKRLGGGDFSSPIPTEGNDEFALLGEEFNSMSSQLEGRLDELSKERARLRESIRRIGETFASNLDRPALLQLALRTAVDAVHAESGRLTARAVAEELLAETSRVGSLAGIEKQIHDAERAALGSGALGESASAERSVACIALGPIEGTDRVHGLITVCRAGRSFTDDDRDLLRSLGTQATLALENVDLHFQVRRQAITDELTGLANHGRFQDLLGAELEQVRRYHHQVGLILLDIDDFKAVNDTYGHQQGDLVLKQVARVMRAASRDADTPARYGGEEMALILPHTDLQGSYAIAERLRSAIAGLRIPRLDDDGVLRVTASLGVAASSEGLKEVLVGDADSALYAAKRQGKNRTVKARSQTANVVSAE